MSAVAAMKQQRLEHALRGVPLSEEQQRSLVAASHGLDTGWTDWIAELIEVARAVGSSPVGEPR